VENRPLKILEIDQNQPESAKNCKKWPRIYRQNARAFTFKIPPDTPLHLACPRLKIPTSNDRLPYLDALTCNWLMSQKLTSRHRSRHCFLRHAIFYTLPGPILSRQTDEPPQYLMLQTYSSTRRVAASPPLPRCTTYPPQLQAISFSYRVCLAVTSNILQLRGQVGA
jgi:hypothetical protein